MLFQHFGNHNALDVLNNGNRICQYNRTLYICKLSENCRQFVKYLFQSMNLFFYACKTMKPGFFWYAVDTNLFRLGSTNPKKIPRPWILFGAGLSSPPEKKNVIFFFEFFFSKMFKYFTCKIRNRLNRKKNQISYFFRFLFFELWSFRDQIVRDQIVLVPNCPGTELSGSELS